MVHSKTSSSEHDLNDRLKYNKNVILSANRRWFLQVPCKPKIEITQYKMFEGVIQIGCGECVLNVSEAIIHRRILYR